MLDDLVLPTQLQPVGYVVNLMRTNIFVLMRKYISYKYNALCIKYQCRISCWDELHKCQHVFFRTIVIVLSIRYYRCYITTCILNNTNSAILSVVFIVALSNSHVLYWYEPYDVVQFWTLDFFQSRSNQVDRTNETCSFTSPIKIIVKELRLSECRGQLGGLLSCKLSKQALNDFRKRCK